jgi:outer membrane protein
MKFSLRSLVALTLSLGGLLTAQDARLKVATVDMQALFQEYHETKATRTKFEGEQTRVVRDRDERLARLNELKKEIDELQKQLGDPSVADAKKQTLFNDRQAKQQQFESLQKELEEFIQRKSRALNEQMQLRMKAILEEIRGKVQQHAADEGYDYVLDKTGASTSQVPILLYTKDATDITEVLLKGINAGAPAAPAPADEKKADEAK